MGEFAWVTLATNDSYSLGALVLAHSLKQAGTAHKLVVLVTPGVTKAMREKLASVFNVVQEVNILDSKDEANLRLLKRPELGITFTKLHCWRLTQFEKCVFLDADTLVLKNADELFEREEFSAAPDVGWPDCFNSGVFVYRPSNETYEKLVRFALDKGSFDGGDQGLLNLYFSEWAHQDISKHLPFIYNMCSTACYSYLPAFKQFGTNVKIVHFIGAVKPWLQYFDTETQQVQPSSELQHLQSVLQRWWDIFCSLIHPHLTSDMGGLAGAFSQFNLGSPRSATQSALEDHIRRQGWEIGNIDYMGRDCFDNIWLKITQTLATAPQQENTKEPPPPSEPVQKVNVPDAEQQKTQEVPIQQEAEKPKEAETTTSTESLILKQSEISDNIETQQVISEPLQETIQSEPTSEPQAKLAEIVSTATVETPITSDPSTVSQLTIDKKATDETVKDAIVIDTTSTTVAESLQSSELTEAKPAQPEIATHEKPEIAEPAITTSEAAVATEPIKSLPSSEPTVQPQESAPPIEEKTVETAENKSEISTPEPVQSVPTEKSEIKTAEEPVIAAFAVTTSEAVVAKDTVESLPPATSDSSKQLQESQLPPLQKESLETAESKLEILSPEQAIDPSKSEPTTEISSRIESTPTDQPVQMVSESVEISMPTTIEAIQQSQIKLDSDIKSSESIAQPETTATTESSKTQTIEPTEVITPTEDNKSQTITSTEVQTSAVEAILQTLPTEKIEAKNVIEEKVFVEKSAEPTKPVEGKPLETGKSQVKISEAIKEPASIEETKEQLPTVETPIVTEESKKPVGSKKKVGKRSPKECPVEDAPKEVVSHKQKSEEAPVSTTSGAVVEVVSPTEEKSSNVAATVATASATTQSEAVPTPPPRKTVAGKKTKPKK